MLWVHIYIKYILYKSQLNFLRTVYFYSSLSIMILFTKYKYKYVGNKQMCQPVTWGRGFYIIIVYKYFNKDKIVLTCIFNSPLTICTVKLVLTCIIRFSAAVSFRLDWIIFHLTILSSECWVLSKLNRF